MRWGRKPDGVCLVVGTLGSGFTRNDTGDVIYTTTPLQPDDAQANKSVTSQCVGAQGGPWGWVAHVLKPCSGALQGQLMGLAGGWLAGRGLLPLPLLGPA